MKEEIQVTEYIKVYKAGLSYTYSVKNKKGKWKQVDYYFPTPELAIKDAIQNEMYNKSRNKEFKDINKFIKWKRKMIKKLMEDVRDIREESGLE